MPSTDPITRHLLDRVLPGTLPSLLSTQRWFGSKARVVDRVAVRDFAWLPGAPHANGLCIAEVAFAQGRSERYALVIGRRAEPGAAPVVAGPSDGETLWTVEATAEQDGAYALMAGFAGSSHLLTERGGAIRFADATSVTADTIASRPPARAVGVEQSNSSVRLGHGLVFKLLRRLDDGENPELEIGRFLTTRTGFRAMPALHGSVTYESPEGHAATVAIVQAWVESRGDGWSHVLALLGENLHGEGGLDELGRDLALLGATTAEFHSAMASDARDPAFSPEPATAADAHSWTAALANQAAGVRSLIGGAAIDAGLKQALDQAIGRFANARVSSAPSIGRIAGDGFPKIRIHGDYHLGQTLKTTGGFILLDFEGEPARPLAERRQKQCALKDVAGMLRSFDYALATACHGDLAAAAAIDAQLHSRGRFLDGYLGAAQRHSHSVVPADTDARLAWTRFFELEKALYELAYEANNRPAWAPIPARGILRLLEG
ncbi:MAG: hypothetical protein IT180_14875 [Acidobacteria bacterium]|nr:hypothetical protein [Acidobacteriota bacterium]